MLGWRVLKVTVFLAVLWGAAASLTAIDLPIVGDVIAWAKSANPKFYGSTFLSWVADNWLPFAVIILLLNSMFSRWTLRELSETGGYSRIFIATIMNYFEVETETPGMKKIRESKWNDPTGFWKSIKEGINELLMTRIIGFAQPYDEKLDAKAVRHGDEAHFADDVKKAVENVAPDIDEARNST